MAEDGCRVQHSRSGSRWPSALAMGARLRVGNDAPGDPTPGKEYLVLIVLGAIDLDVGRGVDSQADGAALEDPDHDLATIGEDQGQGFA